MAKSTKSKKSAKSEPEKTAPAASPSPIDPMLLNALICPKTRGALTYDRDTNELISKKAKLAYPVRESVPILLVEEARSLDS